VTSYDKAKIADVTTGPTEVYVPEPGPVRWAEVYLDGDRVGVVWAAAHADARPRAGIINDRQHLSHQFQTDLGPQCLAYAGTTTPPDDFLAFLADSRAGVDGTLLVSGDVSAAVTLHDVYLRLGYEN
jgi:hypothetical protein